MAAVDILWILSQDPRFTAGAGATQIELARMIEKMGDKAPGLDQYAIKKFAEALQIIPQVLAQNSGQDPGSVSDFSFPAETKKITTEENRNHEA